MARYELRIKIDEKCPNRDFVVDYYTNKANSANYSDDSGVDLVFPQDEFLRSMAVTKIDLGISCEMIKYWDRPHSAEKHNIRVNVPFRLLPRSSISNTPLMLANSEGVFDKGYRGNVIVPIRCFQDVNYQDTVYPPWMHIRSGTLVDEIVAEMISKIGYKVEKGQRLFQIVNYDGAPIKVVVVDALSETQRGTNGIGSTGK